MMDGFSCYAWVYLLKHKLEAEDALRVCLSGVRADGVASKVESVMSENGGEFYGGEFGEVCKQYRTKEGFTNFNSPNRRML